MNNVKAWFFRTIGNICYMLNGGLDGLDNNGKLHKAMSTAWGIAYRAEEKAAGRIPER